MVDAFTDARGRLEGRGLRARTRFWVATLMDVAGSAGAEWGDRLRGRSGPVPPRRPGSAVASPSLGTRAESALRELRLAGRALARTPLFTLGVVLILGLSLASATTLWSTVYHVALAPLGFDDEDRLVAVWTRVRRTTTDADFALSDGHLRELRDRSAALGSVSAVRTTGQSAVLESDDGLAERVGAVQVLPDFFRVLGVEAAVGRTFGPDDADGVLLSHAGWVTRYGRDPDVVGRTVRLDGRTRSIVGVLPERFHFPFGDGPPLFWRPASLDATNFSHHSLYAVARMRAGATPADAESEAHRIFAEVADRNAVEPSSRPGWLASVIPLRSDRVATDGSELTLLAGALGLVLLLGTANVTVLMLIRTVGRAREGALRTALGGSATQVAAPLLAELALLLLAAGILALALTGLGTRALRTQSVLDLPRIESVALSLPVLAGGLALATAAAGVVGIVVVWGLRRRSHRAILQAMASSIAGGRLPRSLRFPLLVAQAALSVLLLGGAALLGRTVLALTAVEPGFTTEAVLQAGLRLPTDPMWEPVPEVREVVYAERTLDREVLRVRPAILDLHAQLRERLESHPSIEATTLAKDAPLSGSYGGVVPVVPEWFEGEDGDMPGGRRWITFNVVAPDFLPFLGVELVRGRWLGPEDDREAAPVALVSEALARNLWPGRDALGARFRTYSLQSDPDGTVRNAPGWTTVVGIVRSLREWDLRQAEETYYVPLAQIYAPGTLVDRSSRGSGLRIFVRHDGDVEGAVGHLRQVVADLLPGTPLDEVTPLDALVARQYREPRFFLQILGVCGAVALVLAVGGVFAVVGYGVGHRSREIGIRRALGARPGGLFRLVALDTLAAVALGVGLGLLATWGSGRALESTLFQVRPWDPLSLAAAGALFTAFAAIAAWIPVRRAAASDLARTLRQD